MPMSANTLSQARYWDVDGGPYIKSPSNGKFIEVDAERGDYVLTTDVMGYVANTYDMYIGANIEETDITKNKRRSVGQSNA